MRNTKASPASQALHTPSCHLGGDESTEVKLGQAMMLLAPTYVENPKVEKVLLGHIRKALKDEAAGNSARHE